jgi:hypothetical protein
VLAPSQFQTGSSSVADTLGGVLRFWWTGQRSSVDLPANPMLPSITASVDTDCETVGGCLLGLFCRFCRRRQDLHERFLQTFNSLPNLDVVKCFVQQKSASGATYVIRVAQWSNTTFLNNLHLHDGEPDLLDLACDVCVVRVLQTACLVLCHGERGVSQVVCDSNRDTHVCCASVRQERFGNRHVWWCDCREFHTPSQQRSRHSQSFRVSGRS